MVTQIDQKVSSIVQDQVFEIHNQIVDIDRRLAQLGDSDEDEIERILLLKLRKMLVQDLLALSEFTEEYDLDRVPSSYLEHADYKLEEGEAAV